MKAIQPAVPGRGSLVPVTGRYLLDHREALEGGRVPFYEVLKGPGGLVAGPVDPRSVWPEAQAHPDKKLCLVDKDWQKKLFSAENDFLEDLEPLLDEDPGDRTAAMAALKAQLAALQASGAPAGVRAEAIMGSVSQGFLLNKAGLKDRPELVTVHERALAKETVGVIETAVDMAKDPAVMAALFEAFEGLSNGQTLNHITRVFASFTGFQAHYAKLHSQRLAATVRRVFPEVYAPAYGLLLPDLAPSQLVSDQLLQLPAFDSFQSREFALGAFLHDIGKMGNIDYFEGEGAYDPAQIQQHVFLGAGLVLMNYGNEHDAARMMAGDHHNILGQEGGYGITRLEQQQSQRAPVPTTRVLAGDPRTFVTGEALGWLPTEMLAVADVYDAMTDDSRRYKKGMTPAEAVVFLEDTMAAEGKLDPLLVDLYIDFLRDRGLSVPKDRGFAFKVKKS